MAKKGDGLQVKESTDSSTTLEDDEVKGGWNFFHNHLLFYTYDSCQGSIIGYQ